MWINADQEEQVHFLALVKNAAGKESNADTFGFIKLCVNLKKLLQMDFSQTFYKEDKGTYEKYRQS